MCYKRNGWKVGCLSGFCHHCLVIMSIHTHAYCYHLFESGMKIGCEQSLYVKDLRVLLCKHKEWYLMYYWLWWVNYWCIIQPMGKRYKVQSLIIDFMQIFECYIIFCFVGIMCHCIILFYLLVLRLLCVL